MKLQELTTALEDGKHLHFSILETQSFDGTGYFEFQAGDESGDIDISLIEEVQSGDYVSKGFARKAIEYMATFPEIDQAQSTSDLINFEDLK